jgi:hypothetical protein
MSVVPNFDINWNALEQIEMDDELENTFLQLTALDVPLNIRIDENTIVTVAEVHQPPCSATEPAPTQPYIETDHVLSQPYTEETSSEAETIRPGPITMATESMHSVSDPVPSPTQLYTTEEPGPLTMANEFVHVDSNEALNLNDDEIQQFIESNDNRNTSKKTLNDIKKVENFLKQRNENRKIHKIPVNELDSLMANFIIAAKKKDGSDYEPTSIRGIISSIDRKLRRHRYGHYIGGDEKHTKFPLTKETLKTKMKLLKKQGKGNKPNRAQPNTDSELDILYESNLLGGSSPEALLNSIWFNNSVHFVVRGV